MEAILRLRAVKNRIADVELIALIRPKSKAGAHALYDNYADVLLLIIFRMVFKKDVAAVILEQVIVQAWDTIELYEVVENYTLFNWLNTIARNLSRQYLDMQLCDVNCVKYILNKNTC